MLELETADCTIVVLTKPQFHNYNLKKTYYIVLIGYMSLGKHNLFAIWNDVLGLYVQIC